MSAPPNESASVQALIQSLRLTHHDEGGYFRQLYESDWVVNTPERPGESRPGLNTIYYLLTAQNRVGHLHRNASDILHFFHAGGPLTYWLVSPEGTLQRVILGPDPSQGHHFQLTVPGGYWKASCLAEGEYGLISEAVAPGFDYRDRTLATVEAAETLFPHLLAELRPYLLTH